VKKSYFLKKKRFEEELQDINVPYIDYSSSKYDFNSSSFSLLNMIAFCKKKKL